MDTSDSQSSELEGVQVSRRSDRPVTHSVTQVVRQRKELSIITSSIAESNQPSPVKTPIILAKPDKLKTTEAVQIKSTKILPRSSEAEVRLASSPKHGIPTALLAGDIVSSPPVYRIQQRDGIKQGGSWTSVLQAIKPVKLIDDFMNFTGDAISEYLLEQNEFRVIGVLGMEGAGKTHVLSLLANYGRSSSDSPFATSMTTSENGSVGHTTRGLDIFITPQRTVLIDSMPILSSSVLDFVMANERKFSGEHTTGENIADSQCLQLVMFLLSVCHTVLVVEDWFTDMNIHRLLQTAEILKPPPLSSSEKDEGSDYHAKLVFVQNKIRPEEVSEHEMSNMEAALSCIYKNSKLNTTDSKGKARLCVTPLHESGENVAERETQSEQERAFVRQIMGLPVGTLLPHTTLSERHWLQFANKMWDAIKKSALLSEYIRTSSL